MGMTIPWVFSYILFICSVLKHVCIGKNRNACKVLMGKLKERGNLEDPSR